MGGGGKSGGGSVTATQPNVTPSPYQNQLASMAQNIYGETQPLRKYYLESWLKFLNPTGAAAVSSGLDYPSGSVGSTALPSAYNTQGSTPYAGTATQGGVVPSGANFFIDPSTGQVYGGSSVQEVPGVQGAYQVWNPASNLNVQVNPVSSYVGNPETPQGQQQGSSNPGGSTGSQPNQSLSGLYNPAYLPGYTPMYEIGRRGLESQYNTALQQTISGTPRGGALSEAINRLNLGRAESVGSLPGQISSQLIQDMLNKSYGAAFQAPQQSIGALSSASNAYTSTQNAMINAAMQANALNQSASMQGKSGLGSLGTGVGSLVGSAFGSPWLGKAIGI